MIARVVESFKAFDEPLIVTHVDADGITSASIINQVLARMGKRPQVLAVKQLDIETIEDNHDRELIFTDMGSGLSDHIPAGSVVIDHHQPHPTEHTDFLHFNAHLQGMDGSHEVTSSGLAYLIARELGFYDLVTLGIVGAVGDLQDRSGFKGQNAKMVEEGAVKGHITREKGLSFFGRETRPLHVFLQYSSDPYIPGLTGRPDACLELIERSGIHMFSDSWRTYHDLSVDEKKRLITSVHLKAIQAGLEPWEVKSLLREYYTIPSNPRHTELRDVTEFATLLNACGRNDRAEIGIGVCIDPGKNYPDAKALLSYHRKLIAAGIDEILDVGTEKFGKHLSVFWSEQIKPTIIGIIIGMGVGAGLVDGRIIVGAVPDDGKIKISLRMPSKLLRMGVNLGLAASQASEKAGGQGGGHDVAAGCEVPEHKFSLFLAYLDQALAQQFKEKPVAEPVKQAEVNGVGYSENST